MWTLLWSLGNLAWIARDRMLRDGDEEGHVGAAELFRQDLLDGHPLLFLRRLWLDEMGDYPSLHAALVGAWWWATGAGEPGQPLVRGVGLVWTLLAAAAVGRLGARAGIGALVFVLATLLPLPVGLSRHFMPEGLLVALVALTALAAWRLAEQPGPGRSLALGLAVGAALLCKQPALLLLLALLPAALGGRVRPLQLLPALLGAGALAGPWYLREGRQQLQYGLDSALSQGEAGLGAHLLFYPLAALLLVLGPPLGLAALLGLGALRGPRRRLALLAGAWLLGSVLLLTAVPKKYPRLLAPAAPAAALLAGLGLAGLPGRSRRFGSLALGAAAAAWLGWRSVSPPLLLPPPIQGVVPGCPQHWLRAPIDDDLGMDALSAWVAAAGPGPVLVIDGPEIPCAVQTTFPWAQHLGPHLRRIGLDREVLTEVGRVPVSLELRWRPGPLAPGEEGVAVPRLGGAFRRGGP